MTIDSIAAIVVWYNPEVDIAKNVLSYADVGHIFIIDNSDESHQRSNELQYNSITKKIKNVSYKRNNKNMGLAYALNYGITCAQKLGFEYFMTVDQDSFFEKNSIYELIKYSEESDDIGLISPKHKYRRYRKGKRKYRHIKWAMTSGCILFKHILDEVGMFDETFFIDGLDRDICHRIRNAGYKLIEVEDAVLVHNPGIEKSLFKGKVLYGWQPAYRYYYVIGSLWKTFIDYNDAECLFIILLKLSKVLFLFDDKKEYFMFSIRGFFDAKNGCLGQIDVNKKVC